MLDNCHKITFEMSWPICFVDRPIFDGLMVYCWMTEKYGNIPVRLDLLAEQLCEFKGLPIDYHKDGYPLSSIMLFDKGQDAQYTGSWKKRWAEKSDGLADFKKSKRKFHAGKGAFKSYDMPIQLHNIKTVWFYFKGDAEEVGRLIDQHLAGIGKKISQGNGFFDSYEIESADDRIFEDILLRPIPIEYSLNARYTETTPHVIRYCGYRPSYYLHENMKKCIYPSL